MNNNLSNKKPLFKKILAVAISTVLFPAISFAQEKSKSTIEEVVVTGTRITGTAKDGELPVDVYSASELEDIGSPSPVEFVKSLSIQGNTRGENSYLGGATATTQYNLRALGEARTLSLVNGLRTNPDINSQPSIALDHIDILREGAAALYGANAIGGVVNAVTLSRYEGVKINASYGVIPDASGEYSLGGLWGIGSDNLNFYTSLEREVRPEIEATDRDFTIIPYSSNATNSAPFGNPGNFTPLAADASGNYTAYPGLFADFNENSCEAPGGTYRRFNETGGYPICSWNWPDFVAVQSKQEVTRSYSQLSGDINDDTSFRVSALFFKSLLPESRRSPVYAPSAGPGGYSLNRSYTNQWVVPGTNPYVQDFITQNNVNLAPYSAVLDPNDPSTYGFSALFWLPYGLNGNEASSVNAKNGAAISRVENKTVQIDFSVDGSIGDTSIDWEVSGGYRRSTTDNTRPALLGFRVQEAINGFGGPNCNAPDLVPYVPGDYSTVGTQNPGLAGVGDCMYFNPFASAWDAGAINGVANPRYIAGNENSGELSNWLFDRSPEEYLTKDLELNVALNGEMPVELPGGNIGWAAGLQRYENSYSRKQLSPYAAVGGDYPCAWPEQQVGDPGCPSNQGPYISPALIENVKNQELNSSAIFAEFGLPLHEKFNLQAAVRYEDYNTGINTTVWKLAGLWRATDWLSVRGSASTNFNAPPADIVPGEVTTYVQSVAAAANRWLTVSRITDSSIVPEEAEVFDFGLIFNFDVGEGDMNILLDYFDITINDEIATVNANAIANQVIDRNSTTQFADCSHPLAYLITFSGGCTNGVTTGADIDTVRTFQTNRPGRNTSGIDLDVTYHFPAFSGDMTIGLRSTVTTSYEQEDFIYKGTLMEAAVDGNGYLNMDNSLESNSKTRATLWANYNWERHNIRMDYIYRSGMEDRRPLAANLSIIDGTYATIPNPVPLSTYAENVDSTALLNVFYNFQYNDNLRISAGINNLTDENPPAARVNQNYLQLQGSARGRTLQMGLSYEF